MKKLSQIIDDQVFKLTDQLKNSSAFQQSMSPLESLSEDIQGIVNKVISVLIPLIPCLIFCVLLFNNFSLRIKQARKQDMMEVINDIKKQKNVVVASEKQLLSNMSVTSQDDFQAVLNKVANKTQMSPTQVKIMNFNQESIGALSRSKAMISIENFSTRDLSRFLKQLMSFEKVKVESINLRKFKTTLKGTLDIIHYSKNSGIKTL